MTGNWIASASRAMTISRTNSAHPNRRARGASLQLEHLEYRLSLSAYSAGAVITPALNPQPLPPGRVVPEIKHLPVATLGSQPPEMTPDPTCSTCAPHLLATAMTQDGHAKFVS